MTVQLVWHSDPAVQQTIETLGRAGLTVEADDRGMRAASGWCDTAEQLLGALIDGGLRIQIQGLAEDSGPSITEPVGEVRGGRRPGTHLEVVR